MAKISKDLSSGNLHPRETIFATGTISALNGVVACAADGAATLGVSIAGTYSGTLTFEGSIDGTNWDTIPVKPINAGGIYVLVLGTGTVGRWTGPLGPFTQIRARASTWTSGSATVTIGADMGVSAIESFVRAADQSVTVTAAAGAAATLNLPSAGTGLFHYITRLLIQRHTSALLTAGAAPVLVTTTNLSGSRVFSIPADAAAQGQVHTELLEPSNPLRSSVAGTATTIVAPATPNVIWRITADYYAGS